MCAAQRSGVVFGHLVDTKRSEEQRLLSLNLSSPTQNQWMFPQSQPNSGIDLVASARVLVSLFLTRCDLVTQLLTIDTAMVAETGVELRRWGSSF